jgi:hypothetical protein
MNLAVKFNLLKDIQSHYIYKPESCLENDNYKLYFDRTVLTDIHIQHNRPDIIILNKQQKQAYLLDIAVPNSHNITQTYNTKINKYLELSVAMRNLWCLEKISILPFIISATGIVPQSLFKNLKILDLDNKLVVEIQKGILLYSCHIVRKFLNIDTEHKTQKSQNVEARRRLISTALLLDSIIRNSVCTPAKLPCRRVEVGYETAKNTSSTINLNSVSELPVITRDIILNA